MDFDEWDNVKPAVIGELKVHDHVLYPRQHETVLDHLRCFGSLEVSRVTKTQVILSNGSRWSKITNNPVGVGRSRYFTPKLYLITLATRQLRFKLVAIGKLKDTPDEQWLRLSSKDLSDLTSKISGHNQ